MSYAPTVRVTWDRTHVFEKLEVDGNKEANKDVPRKAGWDKSFM